MRDVPYKAEGSSPAGEAIPRRVALRRAGALAVGAVAGGAALVATTATPAAAATVIGSGNPGVSATGQGGDGVNATTNTAAKAAIRGATATAGAFGVAAAHTGAGTALSATGNSTLQSQIPAARIANTGGGVALEVSAPGSRAATFDGIVSVKAGASAPAIAISNLNVLSTGVEVQGPGAGSLAVGFKAEDVRVGALLTGTTTGLSVEGEEHHLVLNPTPGTAPPERGPTDPGRLGAIVMHGTDLWLCVQAGTPGLWRRLGGLASTGALQVLDVPGRAYDSRPGTTPEVGAKTKLQPNVVRVVDLTAGARCRSRRGRPPSS